MLPAPLNANKRRYLCQQCGFPSRYERKENFLNLTAEEIEYIKKKKENSERKKEARFQKMLNSYMTGIRGNEGIMKYMNELVATYNFNCARKKAEMHKKWQKQVFELLDTRLEKKLDALNIEQIEEKLGYCHYKYINASNTKLLFRDILTSDYDPFESLKLSIKYSKKGITDPTKHDLMKEMDEKQMNGEKVTEYAVTRKILEPMKWTYRSFRSTIWGHYNVDDDDGSSITVKYLEKWFSHDLLYNLNFNGKSYWREEFPRGKRVLDIQETDCKLNDENKHHGKAKVYGVQCLTQPSLQLFAT